MYPGMLKRKGVRFPSCRATVRETKAVKIREASGARGKAKRLMVMPLSVKDGKAGE